MARPRHHQFSRQGQLVRAVELSTLFHEAAPRAIHQVDIEWPKALVLIGPCLQLDYLSDKYDGKVRWYYHNFEKPSVVFAAATPQPDGDNVLVIKGKFRITADGIVG